MIIVIVGPTCSNKTSTSIDVALKMNAEIINADAFQCYKELNIGVAKPTFEEMSRVSHHLFSFCSPDEKFSIADYQKIAREKIAEIINRGKNIVLVGGSGLYIRSLLYDYEFKESDETSISSDKYLSYSNEELYNLLAKIDPEEAKKLHPNNRKRVERALTIFDEFHKTKSELIASQNHDLIFKDVYFVSPIIDRDNLYNRINVRVDKMIDEGLVNEVKNLISKYGGNVQSLQAIGYKEFISYFKKEITLEETIELIKKNTRNYAKRQITFIKHQFKNVYFYKDTDDLINYLKGVSRC